MERENVRNANQTDRTKRFVKNMRALREQKGWSAQFLEDELTRAHLRGEIEVKLARVIIANLENDRRDRVTLDEAVALAHVLNTTIGWLCDYDGPACNHCLDNPPEGYACKVCLADTDVRFKPYVEPKEE